MGFVPWVRANASGSSHRPSGCGRNRYLPSVAAYYSTPPQLASFAPLSLDRMLSLKLRLPFDGDTILPLNFRRCYSTMDSEGDHATLNWHSGPSGWSTRHEHLKKIVGHEGLRVASLRFSFEVPMLIPHSDKWPGNMCAYRDRRHHPVFTRCFSSMACTWELSASLNDSVSIFSILLVGNIVCAGPEGFEASRPPVDPSSLLQRRRPHRKHYKEETAQAAVASAANS
jgi:hypothetical protein